MPQGELQVVLVLPSTPGERYISVFTYHFYLQLTQEQSYRSALSRASDRLKSDTGYTWLPTSGPVAIGCKSAVQQLKIEPTIKTSSTPTDHRPEKVFRKHPCYQTLSGFAVLV